MEREDRSRGARLVPCLSQMVELSWEFFLFFLGGVGGKKSQASREFWCVPQVSSDEKRPAVGCLVDLAPPHASSGIWEVQKELVGGRHSPHGSWRLEWQLERHLSVSHLQGLPLGAPLTKFRTFHEFRFACPQLHDGAGRAGLSFQTGHIRPGGGGLWLLWPPPALSPCFPAGPT